MSKKSETEYLKGVIRGLEKQVKELRKQLSKKSAIKIQVEESKPKDKFHKVEQELSCPKCANPLQETNLGIRILVSCSNPQCDYRQTLRTKL